MEFQQFQKNLMEFLLIIMEQKNQKQIMQELFQVFQNINNLPNTKELNLEKHIKQIQDKLNRSRLDLT